MIPDVKAEISMGWSVVVTPACQQTDSDYMCCTPLIMVADECYYPNTCVGGTYMSMV